MKTKADLAAPLGKLMKLTIEEALNAKMNNHDTTKKGTMPLGNLKTSNESISAGIWRPIFRRVK